jgi:hypothetical protein
VNDEGDSATFLFFFLTFDRVRVLNLIKQLEGLNHLDTQAHLHPVLDGLLFLNERVTEVLLNSFNLISFIDVCPVDAFPVNVILTEESSRSNISVFLIILLYIFGFPAATEASVVGILLV